VISPQIQRAVRDYERLEETHDTTVCPAAIQLTARLAARHNA
jgi:hypothetical protein